MAGNIFGVRPQNSVGIYRVSNSDDTLSAPEQIVEKPYLTTGIIVMVMFTFAKTPREGVHHEIAIGRHRFFKGIQKLFHVDNAETGTVVKSHDQIADPGRSKPGILEFRNCLFYRLGLDLPERFRFLSGEFSRQDGLESPESK
jgi:hypothetical protein